MPNSGSSLTCTVCAVWPFPGFHSTRNGPAPALPLFSIVTSTEDGLPANSGCSTTSAILRFASAASTVNVLVTLENGDNRPAALAVNVELTDPVLVYVYSMNTGSLSPGARPPATGCVSGLTNVFGVHCT